MWWAGDEEELVAGDADSGRAVVGRDVAITGDGSAGEEPDAGRNESVAGALESPHSGAGKEGKPLTGMGKE